MRPSALLLGVASFVVLWFVGWLLWSVSNARLAAQSVFAPYADGAAWAGLSQSQQAILLAVEDPAFETGRPWSWQSPGAGQTIARRLADWHFVGVHSPGLSRFEATLIAALVIGPRASPDAQRAAYVATVPMGARDGVAVVGLEAASRAYFRTPLARLERNAFVRLMAVAQDPARLEMNSDANWAFVDRIEALFDASCAAFGPNAGAHQGCADR